MDTGQDPAPGFDAGTADAAWLEGTWAVQHTLETVSSAAFTQEADIGEVDMTVRITDGDMAAGVDGIVYSGPVVFGEANFRFEGSASYMEGGASAESDLLIDGLRTGEDSWSAEAYVRVRSQGKLQYEATWAQQATRVGS